MWLQSVVALLICHLKRWPEFYLAIICFLSIRWYFKYNNQVLVHWPIVGILPSLIQNIHRLHDWTVEISNTFGYTKLVRGPIFSNMEMLFTCNPRNVEYIYRTNFYNYPKGADYNKTFDILGEGLFNIDFELWHTQRSTARLVVASNNYRGIIDDVSRKVVEHSLIPLLSHVARQQSVVDMEDVFLRYTFDATFTGIFGRDPKSLSISFPRNKFAEAMEDALEAVFYRHVTPHSWWKLCRWLMIGKERRLSKAWQIIDQSIAHHISLKKEELLKGVEETDLLTIYMNLQENGLVSKGDKFLRDTVLTFLFAGRDTTGVALSWFLWLVSMNPHTEAKILEELKHLVSKTKNTTEQEKKPWVFNLDDLKGLVYLHAAVCEALRLYPSVPINRKNPIQDDVLPDGTAVTLGTTVIISAYAMARMKNIWGKDSQEFIPERWLDEHGKLHQEAMSKFFTFSVGPRTCLGKNTAFTVIKTAAAAILFNFRVEVVEGQSVVPKPSLVLRMKNGLMVRIKERVV